VWEILTSAGVDPAPRRATVTWAEFLRSQAEAVLAMDFIETVTLTRVRQYILAVAHHAGRRVHILGTTGHPTHTRVAQAVLNPLMDLDGAGSLSRVRFLIRDRDGKYLVLMDTILSSARVATVLTGVRMPHMNTIMERWVKTLRAELLDRKRWRTRVELANAIFEYLEIFHNRQRRHSTLGTLTPIEYEKLHPTAQTVA